MHQVETAPATAAGHVSAPVRVVLPEVRQARRERQLLGAALSVALVAVTVFAVAVIWASVPA